MKKINVDLGSRSYDIFVGYRIIGRLAGIIQKFEIGQDAVIITNPTIHHLHGGLIQSVLSRNGYNVRFILVADSERSKSYRACFDVINKIATLDVKKKIFIVALGGGVIGDLAGFIASVYKRGINYIQIPTTLLAQVDSAIGGKVAIDLSVAKNLVGSFYQPRLVLSDLSFLRTLSLRQTREGLAEIIKYAIIKDSGLFAYIKQYYKDILRMNIKVLETVVSNCSSIKARLVSIDERDTQGKRVILNFGHTIGHAIEAASGYSKEYSHGEAVAVGMIIAARISNKLKMLNVKSLRQIESLIGRVGLPTCCHGLRLDDILNAQSHDKKFIHGKNRFVLPLEIGKVKVLEDIPPQVIESAVKSCLE